MSNCARCEILDRYLDADGGVLSDRHEKSLASKDFATNSLCKQCLLDVKAEKKEEKDPTFGEKKHKSTKKVKAPKVVVSVPSIVAPLPTHVWEYYDNQKTNGFGDFWHRYDDNASVEIEKEYTEYMCAPHRMDVR